MEHALPRFMYHPDPVSTGAVKADADAPCLACNRIRGYIYVGPAYSEKFHHLTHALCPWWIRCEAVWSRVTDAAELAEIDGTIAEEVACRTPGFDAWQQARW